MRRLTPKQLEIRDRERLVLDVAQEMLLTRGYVGLTMERVAAEVGVSKGTVYQHFANKEDLLAAVALRSSDIRANLFERAATFRGTPRERMGAIGAAAELFFALYPHHEQAERVIRASSIAAKIDPERSSKLESCTFRCFSAATGVVRDGIAACDLKLRDGQTVEQVCAGLWNLYIGAFLMNDLENFIDEPTINDPVSTLFANAMVFLDGFRWAPLSTDFDYAASRRRVLANVFPQEALRAGLLTAAEGSKHH